MYAARLPNSQQGDRNSVTCCCFVCSICDSLNTDTTLHFKLQELGVLAGAALVATLLSQPSFSAVAKAKFAAAVSQRKADPAHEAVYYSAFVNALAFLLVFVFAYAYLFPSAINGFEITALADPLVISAGSLLLPAGLLFAQSRSSRSLLV